MIYVRDYFYLSSQVEAMQRGLHGCRHAALFHTRQTPMAFENKANWAAGGPLPCRRPSRSSPQGSFPGQPQEVARSSGRARSAQLALPRQQRAAPRCLQVASGEFPWRKKSVTSGSWIYHTTPGLAQQRNGVDVPCSSFSY